MFLPLYLTTVRRNNATKVAKAFSRSQLEALRLRRLRAAKIRLFLTLFFIKQLRCYIKTHTHSGRSFFVFPHTIQSGTYSSEGIIDFSYFSRCFSRKLRFFSLPHRSRLLRLLCFHSPRTSGSTLHLDAPVRLRLCFPLGWSGNSRPLSSGFVRFRHIALFPSTVALSHSPLWRIPAKKCISTLAPSFVSCLLSAADFIGSR